MAESGTERQQVSFITVNWRSAAAVATLAESLAHVVRAPFELLVFNNDPSESRLLRETSESHEWCHIIEAAENLGFAAGCNRGAAAAGGSYFIFVNPDIRIERLPHAVLRELHTRFGARVVFGTLLQAKGRVARGSVRRFPSFGRALIHSCGFDRLLPWCQGSGLFYNAEAALPPWEPVEQPIGAFFGVGRSAFEELGGFDERFFVFFEEVDLAFRAHLADIPVVLLPDTTIEHSGGHSTRADRTIAIGLRWQSLRAFHTKHDHSIHLPPSWLLIGLEAFRFWIQRHVLKRGTSFDLGRALRIARGSGLDPALARTNDRRIE